MPSSMQRMNLKGELREMNKHEFHAIMLAGAIAFDYDLQAQKEVVYFNMFQSWSEDEFGLAMKACVKELDRFPKPKQLIERRPKVQTKPIQFPPRSIMPSIDDEQLNALSEDDVFDVLLPMWDDSTVCNTETLKREACQFAVGMFKNGDANVRQHVWELVNARVRIDSQ